MKKGVMIAAGIAGLLFGQPSADAHAEVNISINAGHRAPSFVLDTRPTFVNIATRGFSVSYGAPYDIVCLENAYYLHDGGSWYRSSHYNGPWVVVSERGMPERLRGYRIEDIRRYRDDEYRRMREIRHVSDYDRGPRFEVVSRPDFVRLDREGFSMAYGSPYDIILVDNVYYLNHGGMWYRSSRYNGPWMAVRNHTLPHRIRRHRIEDIRRYRDIEYRRLHGRHDDRDRHVERRGDDRRAQVFEGREHDSRGFDRDDRDRR